MEFKEFSNPEEKDYDITSSLTDDATVTSNSNDYMLELIELIGLLEDVTDEEVQNAYGISLQEYFKPNAKTIMKVKQTLRNRESRNSR